jgi:hypothetical protein
VHDNVLCHARETGRSEAGIGRGTSRFVGTCSGLHLGQIMRQERRAASKSAPRTGLARIVASLARALLCTTDGSAKPDVNNTRSPGLRLRASRARSVCAAWQHHIGEQQVDTLSQKLVKAAVRRVGRAATERQWLLQDLRAIPGEPSRPQFPVAGDEAVVCRCTGEPRAAILPYVFY